MFTITTEMSILTLIIIFFVALVALVKGADYLLEGAERVGKYFKLPSFVIGALIVGIGTSLPELATSSFAVSAGVTDIVAANVIGSNIANILLVAGLAAIVGKIIHTNKNLIRLEIPLLVISTSLFLFVAYDGVIDFVEAVVVLFAFIIYLTYLLNADRYKTADDKEEQRLARIEEEKIEEVKEIG
jgi:cation:H+ antiporter